MTSTFDIFRRDKDGLVWRATADSLDEANATVVRLGKIESSGIDFVILNQETQEQIIVRRALLSHPSGV